MEENKVPKFLYPASLSTSNPIVQPNFVINPIASDLGLPNFSLSPRQVPITQIYASRKIKHPSFRKRASSGSMPYYIPFRNRQRTKSENADGQATQQTQAESMDAESILDKNLVDESMDPPLHHVNSNPQFNKIKLSQLKKSKSMESLLPKPDDKESAVSSACSTLEFVSYRIQKLKFNE